MRAGARLPVHVFIHGGGLTNGSGSQNDESKLVKETGVIGVSLNYRLGVFGFLGLPALTEEGGESGNYGCVPGIVSQNAHSHGPAGRAALGAAQLVQPSGHGGSCRSGPQARAEAAGTAFARQAGCDVPRSGQGDRLK
ncbi:hypothetical protein Z951_15295 [Streptomyces sp. PRh5]|uniref:carboxylesterase family protein n=1 Tax=Streptomyces sp. PRh5 TaxID=1158056 RepID=UPI0004482418|nr:carboxylesterase family protein [Streptomyces sp. PRh5]EXU67315.1 hypothetical protein Z951_15295 [Streptomyces sp. PRh5]